MQWLPILLAVLDTVRPFLEDCLQPTPEGVERLRGYGPRVQMAVYKGAKAEARREGKSRREARRAGRAAVDEGREYVRNATDDELMGTIVEMREMCEDCNTDDGAAHATPPAS